MIDWHQYLISDPQICHGELCATGTRVLLTNILDSLAVESIISARVLITSGKGLSFLGQLDDPFARAQSELKVPEEVEPQKTVYPAFCRNVMAQNYERVTF